MTDWSESLIFAQPINKRQPHSIMEQLKSILRHFDIKRSEGLSQFIIDLALEKPYKFGQVIFYDKFVHVTFSNSKYSQFTPLFNDKSLISYYENKKQQMAKCH